MMYVATDLFRDPDQEAGAAVEEDLASPFHITDLLKPYNRSR